MKGAFVSSYYPRESGLTSFNKDLLTNLAAEDTSLKQVGIAINEGNSLYDYPKPVKWQIRKTMEDDYVKVAEEINKSNIDFVCLQHEFSQFGGYNGGFILSFIQALQKPLICICHTVPIRKDAHKPLRRKDFFIDAAPRVSLFVTLLPDAKDSLVSYGIPANKIVVIPHGIRDISSFAKPDPRLDLGIKKDIFMIYSFGWLHKNKGTIYGVEAMEIIKKRGIPAKLFITGNVLNNNKRSKDYLTLIKETIARKRLEDYVNLTVDYIPDSEIYKYINACNAGLIPYAYSSYTASGPLSFFIGGEKPIIATGFAYADSILPKNAYLRVPFRDDRAIAEAIEKLYANENLQKSLSNNIKFVKKKYLWSVIARKYIEAFLRITK